MGLFHVCEKAMAEWGAAATRQAGSLNAPRAMYYANDYSHIHLEVIAVPKEIILYNLAPHVSDEQYADYLERSKGPLMDGLASCDKFELVKIDGAVSANGVPYNYVGIMHLNSLKDFYEKDAASDAFKNFLAEWKEMVVPGWHILYGHEIWPKQ